MVRFVVVCVVSVAYFCVPISTSHWLRFVVDARAHYIYVRILSQVCVYLYGLQRPHSYYVDGMSNAMAKNNPCMWSGLGLALVRRSCPSWALVGVLPRRKRCVATTVLRRAARYRRGTAPLRAPTGEREALRPHLIRSNDVMIGPLDLVRGCWAAFRVWWGNRNGTC